MDYFYGVDTVFANSFSVAIISIVLLFVFALLSTQDQGKRGNFAPGPVGLPVVGNLLQIGSAPHVTLTELSQVYGEVFSLRLGSRRVVVLGSTRVLKEALAKKARHFSDRPPLFTTQLCGSRQNTVAFGEYSPLQVQRKKCVMRALHQSVFSNMQHLDQLVAEETEELVNKFSDNLGKAVDPRSFLRTAVINLAFRLNFGDDNLNGELQQELENILNRANDFVENSAVGGLLDFVPWLHIIFRKQANKIENSIKELIGFVRKVYILRKDQYEDSSCVAATMGRLVPEIKTKCADEVDVSALGQLESTVNILSSDIFGAGLETVSTVFCWSLLYLATDVQLQQDLQNELDRVVGKDRFPSIEDKPNMPLLQATVMEVLRISTVVPFGLPHWTTEDSTVAGYTVSKGTIILVNLWAVNHDPHHFQQPQLFNPYRFLDDDGQLRDDRYAFMMPFSTGSRRCAGSTLAKAELFLFLGGLLQRCCFEASESPLDLSGQFGLTLRPQPFKIYVHLRATSDLHNEETENYRSQH